MRTFLMVASFVALMSFAGRAQAHEGHEHKAMGIVSVVDASHVEVKTTDGKTVSVQLNAETKYLKGKTPAALADVKVAQRVVVSYIEQGEKNVAKEVLLGGTDPAKETR